MIKKISKLNLFLVAFYLFSRFLILKFPPPFFTEIIYSYMPYAHLWAGGMMPYLEQLYEYPPATIPLFYFPHFIDALTLKSAWHFNYGETYKLILLLADFAIFSLIWSVLKKFKVKKNVFIVGILFYIVTTLKAHHFIYDTMDLVFILAIAFGVCIPILFKKKYGEFWSWIGFFLATSLKYINAPLGLLYVFLNFEKKGFRKKIFRSGLAMGLAFVLIWGLPLAIFKSSLQVSFFYHQVRGLQIDSAGAVVARVINAFTHTEKVMELYKNYEMVGPVSTQILNILKIIFPTSIFLYLVWGIIKIVKVKLRAEKKAFQNINILRIYFTLGYIFLFMLVGKVLSTPFLLWHLVLLALFPFRNVKVQLQFLLPSLLIIFISMTGIKNAPIGPIDVHILIGLLRTSLFLYLFVRWLRLKKADYVI